MSEKWRELEAAADRLERALERAGRGLSYSAESECKRDIEKIKEEARRQRQAYVDWLWGYG